MDTGSIKNKIDKDILENIEWLQRTSKEQKESLKNYLLDLDQSGRVDPNSERSKDVLRGVTEILERISTGMKELDPRFQGELVPMGSSNNHTKLGDSNEFDFVYELHLDALLQGRGTFDCYKMHGIVVYCDPAVDMAGQSISDIATLSDATSCFLNVERAASLFHDILVKVMSELKLPSGWQHGGLNRPRFSGLRYHGVSYVLQFDYLKSSDRLPLSVDFVPMIRIPVQDETMSWLHSFLINITKTEYCLVSLNDQKRDPFYGRAEELFLNKYPMASIPKTLIRICKALRDFLQMRLLVYAEKNTVERMLHLLEEGKSGDKDTAILDASNFEIGADIPHSCEDIVPCLDLGENIEGGYMVSSYNIKLIVLTMMAVDESHGCEWTNDDLPNLVITVYKLIADFADEFHFIEDNSIVEEKLSVQLGQIFQTTNPKSPHTEKKLKDYTFNDQKLFTATKSAMKGKDFNFKGLIQMYVICKMPPVFQLFRCICEGRTTAELVYYQTNRATLTR